MILVLQTFPWCFQNLWFKWEILLFLNLWLNNNFRTYTGCPLRVSNFLQSLKKQRIWPIVQVYIKILDYNFDTFFWIHFLLKKVIVGRKSLPILVLHTLEQEFKKPSNLNQPLIFNHSEGALSSVKMSGLSFARVILFD
jgi:hypothetical protein